MWYYKIKMKIYLVPTKKKINLLNKLQSLGYDTVKEAVIKFTFPSPVLFLSYL